MKNFIKNSLIKEIRYFKRGRKTLHETILRGKTIINVDIQPEYQSSIYGSINVSDWVKFLNKSLKSNMIIFLYNGADTLGMVSEQDYKMWLYDLGVSEAVIEDAVFYDKGYAFFRYCMDSSISDDNIIDFVKFMIRNNINDSRDLTSEMWTKFMEEANHDFAYDVRDLLEHSGDMINIPDLMDFLKNKNNIVLTGGGVNECLKEVEIALSALSKPYSVLKQFTY